MSQYINKTKIEEILRSLWKKDDGNNPEHRIYYNKALQEIQCQLDTLETKEVDLEKELETLDRILFDLDGVAIAGTTCYLTVEDVKDIAKQFYELGLFNAQKGN